MEVSLEGRVALVTGAGPNIGSGIALALSRYGAKVACNDVSSEAASASVRRIERHGGSMTFDTSEHGTTFHVWLRLHPSSPVRMEKRP